MRKKIEYREYLNTKFMNIGVKLILSKLKNTLLLLRIRELKEVTFPIGCFLIPIVIVIIRDGLMHLDPILFLLFMPIVFFISIGYKNILIKWNYNLFINYVYIFIRIFIIIISIIIYLIVRECLILEDGSDFVSWSICSLLIYMLFYTFAGRRSNNKDLDRKNILQKINKKLWGIVQKVSLIQWSKELIILLHLISLLVLYILCDGILYNLPFMIFVLLISPLISCILTLPRQKNNDIKITFLNLDFIDVFRSDVFIYKLWMGSKDCRIFKIDFEYIFENFFKSYSCYSECSVTLLNNFCISARIKQKREHIYAYFCVNDIFKPTTVKLNILLSNKNRNDDRSEYIKLDLIMQFDKIGDEIIVQKYEIHNMRKVFFAFNNNRKYGSENMSKHYDFLFRGYQYNDEIIDFENNVFKKLNVDKRKMVFHNGKFGCGKSSLDILLLSNYGYSPVVVSPWEDNYDNDILFLIFQQLMKSTTHKLTVPTTSVMFFFMAAVLSLNAFILKFLEIFAELFEDYNTMISNILNNFVVSYLYSYNKLDILQLLIYITAIIISMLISSILLPYIIIHVKDSSKVHQNYYINKISSLLRQSKQVLVIEDIDRLETEVSKNVFRIISSINKGCISSQRIIGIVSLHKNQLKDEKKDKSNGKRQIECI